MWLVFRYIILAALGSFPGFAIVVFGSNLQIGLPIAVLGSVVGAVLAHPGVSIGRTLRLLLALIFLKNIPFFTDRVMDWVDRNGSDEHEDETDDALCRWLMAWDVEDRRGRFVLLGVLVGLSIGTAIGFHELQVLSDNKRGFFLKPTNKDPVAFVILGTMCLSIWCGSMVGLFASAAYRRPILLGGIFVGFVSTCLGWSTGLLPDIPFFLTTVALALALLWGSMAALDKPKANT